MEHGIRFLTQGINPFHTDEDTMRLIISKELLGQSGFPATPQIDEVYFFGAGCTREKSPLLRGILTELFPAAKVVEVESDMLGAAKALFGDRPGIACILGTGANSCLYDGSRIISNVPPMGYILGDEGSGAVIGKTFLNALYKGKHQDFIPTFESETGLTLPAITECVYRKPMPNRFLASLAPFIKAHISETWINDLVTDCFRLFFQHNVRHYLTPPQPQLQPSQREEDGATAQADSSLFTLNSSLSVSFVGSIAYHFQNQLREAAKAEGLTIAKIMKEPLQQE